MDADFLRILTIASATVAYSLAEWLRLRGTVAERRIRLLWTAAALLTVAHAAAAFHGRHNWSHAAAYRDTAVQTAAVTGLHWGGGLFVNYAFLLVWTADVAWSWLSPHSYRRRPAILSAGIHAFVFFMFANGAVVFATGPIRLLGLAAMLAVAWAWYGRRIEPTQEPYLHIDH
jgi:hypothetical protein